MTLRTTLPRAIALMCLFLDVSSAFFLASRPLANRAFSTSLRAESSSNNAPEKKVSVELLLQKQFPSFHSLLSKNQGIWKELAEAEKETGCTVFAPSEEVFSALGDKKLAQLKDVRNEETAQKMGLYHVVLMEAVSAQRLRTEDWTGPKPADGSPRPITVQALITQGGQVPVGRSKSGGFFGFGVKEDGDVVIGPDARIVKSYPIGKSFVHEVDALVSPVVLWRYCDQLRIPGF